MRVKALLLALTFGPFAAPSARAGNWPTNQAAMPAYLDSVFGVWCDTTLTEYHRIVYLSYFFMSDSTLSLEQASWLKRKGRSTLKPSYQQKQLVNAWLAKGMAWGWKSQLDSGLACYRRAEVMMHKMGHPNASTEVVCYRADLYMTFGRLTEAVLTMQPAAQEFLIKGDTTQAIDALWTIAQSLGRQGNHARAAHEYRRMLVLLGRKQAYRRYNWLLECADEELHAGQPDSAIWHIAQAEAIRQNKEYVDNGVRLTYFKARAHLVRKECVEAQRLLAPLHASLLPDSTQYMYWAPMELELARAHLCLGLPKEAVKFGQRSLSHDLRPPDPVHRMECLKVLADAYKALGDEKLALFHLDAYLEMKDSLGNEMAALAANNAVLLGEFERQRIMDSILVETEHLEERQLSQGAIERVRAQRVVLFIGALLIGVIAMLLLNRARLKRRIQVVQLRARLSRDLHDDIGSTLSSINILSSVARKRVEASGDHDASDALEKISDRSQRLMRNMSDIVWGVDPKKDSLEELLVRMREFSSSLFESKGIAHTFDQPAVVPSISLPVETKNNLYLLFKEAVNNAVKHSCCTHARVAITIHKNILHLSVADDGAGMDMKVPGASACDGNGIRNMRERAAEMRAEFQIVSTIESGTQIRLELPLRV